jgi:hypothetical protein
MLPSWAAIVHCRGHQRDGKCLSQDSNPADRIAKQAALKPLPSQSLFLARHPPKHHTPQKMNKLSSPKQPKNIKAGGVQIMPRTSSTDQPLHPPVSTQILLP